MPLVKRGQWFNLDLPEGSGLVLAPFTSIFPRFWCSCFRPPSWLRPVSNVTFPFTWNCQGITVMIHASQLTADLDQSRRINDSWTCAASSIGLNYVAGLMSNPKCLRIQVLFSLLWWRALDVQTKWSSKKCNSHLNNKILYNLQADLCIEPVLSPE